MKLILAARARLLPTQIDRLEAMVGPDGAWRATQAWQEQFLLHQAGLLPHHKVLEIGCGPLRGGLPLIRRLDPGGYAGVDVRPEAIDEARGRVASDPRWSVPTTSVPR